jgi:undecaprenyl-diphosphatase
MLGASGIKILKFVLDGETAITGNEWIILAIGCVTAFLVSLAAIRYLMDYVKRHSFAAFGVYRILLGALVIGAACMGWIH